MDPHQRSNVATDVGLLTWLFCLLGGAAVGAIGLPLRVLVESGWDRDIGGVALIGGVFGLGFGMVLGAIGALVLGAFAAVVLVPYRGAATTKRIMGVAAALFVASGWCVLFLGLGVLPSGVALWSMIVPSVAGASLLGPVTVRQFIVRNESD